MVKLIIAGGRNVKSSKIISEGFCAALKAFNLQTSDITEEISGGAGGVEKGGEKIAELIKVPVKHFIPDWEDLTHPEARIRINRWGKKYDANAGHRRNAEMAEYGTHLLAVWDGKSPGTKNMIDNAKKRGLAIYIRRTDDVALSEYIDPAPLLSV